MSTVIVFGPTGNVGSIAAQAAAARGAKVVLAMRDPAKAVPGIDAGIEKRDNYQRVQADLTDPKSVAAAVKSSGATRAFFYLAYGNTDHMKATIEALKSAGVTFVVFLSSSTIQVPPADVPQAEMLLYLHAQVELNLAEIYGPGNYVAVRPGRFATNLLRYKDGIAQGNVKLFGCEYRYDNITPQDMGDVSGGLLVSGPQEGQTEVFLYAPKWWTLQDSVKAVAKSLGKDITITPIGKEEGIQEYVKVGVPRPIAELLAGYIERGEDTECGNEELHKISQDNIRKYAGREPLGLEEWLAGNQHLFQPA